MKPEPYVKEVSVKENQSGSIKCLVCPSHVIPTSLSPKLQRVGCLGFRVRVDGLKPKVYEPHTPSLNQP